MDEFPFSYQKIDSTTWAYMSSLLMLALFFKFNRFWSFRNLDLLLVILLAPGLLMVDGGRRWVISHQTETASVTSADPSRPSSGVNPGIRSTAIDAPAASGDSASLPASIPATDDAVSPILAPAPTIESYPNSVGHRWQRLGYIWLFVVGMLLMVRLLIDPALRRRPLLEPNLSRGGLFFFAGSLMFFLAANVIMSEPTAEDLRGARNAVKLLQREAAEPGDIEQLRRRGPGYSFFYLFPILPMFENGNAILSTDADESINLERYVIAAKILAIFSQGLIVLALILFCRFNFDNVGVGVGAAAIYLMLPYTAMFTGHVMHTLPAALILWALVFFRRPWVSGILIGLATGVAYYPIFILPLWASYYWERGVRRFLSGVVIAIAICIGGLIFTSVDSVDFWIQLKSMFGFWSPRMEGLEGIWALGWSRWWRLPILVAFVAFCVSFVAWPTEKNLGTLVSHTASVMVAVQFWHGFGGGLYIAWYLPLLLLMVFRPNVQGRVALSELRESRRRRQETAEDLLPAA